MDNLVRKIAIAKSIVKPSTDEKKVRKYALCKDRHYIPGVTSSIFPATVDFTDLAEIDETADRYVCQAKLDEMSIDLYVTGVQYPLISVINACLRRKVQLTLFHYNPNTDSYYPQKLYMNDDY